MMYLHTPDGATVSHGCCHLRGQMRVFCRWYSSFTSPYKKFLECKGTKFEQVKTMLNAKNFICKLSQSISSDFGEFAIIAEKSRPLFLRSRSSKVIEFDGNRETVYDFLLVINSNLGPISHRYWNTATYSLKITNFSHPLSFSAFVQGDPLQIYGKALQFLKLGSSGQPKVKIW